MSMFVLSIVGFTAQCSSFIISTLYHLVYDALSRGYLLRDTAGATDMEVRPSEIRFKQNSIKSTFQDGRDVNEAAIQLCRQELSPYSFPRIRIAKKNNKYYSFDNRRLYVFRVAEYNGALSSIRVNLAPGYKFDEETFTTDDDGRTVQVRNGRTMKHCKPSWLKTPTFIPECAQPLSNRTYTYNYEGMRVGYRDVSQSYSPPPTRRIRYNNPSTDSWSNPRRNDSVCSCTIL